MPRRRPGNSNVILWFFWGRSVEASPKRLSHISRRMASAPRPMSWTRSSRKGLGPLNPPLDPHRGSGRHNPPWLFDTRLGCPESLPFHPGGQAKAPSIDCGGRDQQRQWARAGLGMEYMGKDGVGLLSGANAGSGRVNVSFPVNPRMRCQSTCLRHPRRVRPPSHALWPMPPAAATGVYGI